MDVAKISFCSAQVLRKDGLLKQIGLRSGRSSSAAMRCAGGQGGGDARKAASADIEGLAYLGRLAHLPAIGWPCTYVDLRVGF